MAIDNGPATGTGVQTFNLPGGPVVTGIEIHVGNPPSQGGINPLPPSAAPYVEVGQAGTTVTGNPVVAQNTNVVIGNGQAIKFANPA